MKASWTYILEFDNLDSVSYCGVPSWLSIYKESYYVFEVRIVFQQL